MPSKPLILCFPQPGQWGPSPPPPYPNLSKLPSALLPQTPAALPTLPPIVMSPGLSTSPAELWAPESEHRALCVPQRTHYRAARVGTELRGTAGTSATHNILHPGLPFRPHSVLPLRARSGGVGESHDREMENIPGIVLRPQPTIVEGSGGGAAGRWGGEVNKIKKAIMRPQHKPCNYAPKFNQNSFPHWACNASNRPVSFCLPGPALEIPQSPESSCRAWGGGRACLPAPPTPRPSHCDRPMGFEVA